MCLFHKWSTWDVIYEGDIQKENKDKRITTIGVYVIQERVCIKCKKKQRKIIETALNE